MFNKIIRKKIFAVSMVLMLSALNQHLFAQGTMADLGNIDYLELLKSSYVMIVLLVLSIAAFAVIIERWLYFRSINVSSSKIMTKIEKFLKQGAFDEMLDYCSSKKTPVTVIIKTIIQNRGKQRADIEEIIDIIKIQQKQIMERFMVTLGSIAAIAPLLGLLGTVTGIIKAFSDLAKAGVGGPAVVAAGVSEALVTTAFGLIVAIPVLYIYNHYNNKIKKILSDADVNSKLFYFMLNDVKVKEVL